MTDEELTQRIGIELRKIREERRLSLREAGAKLGTTNVAILYWEQGKRQISAVMLKNYCDVLNVNLDDFIHKVMND